MSNSATLLCRRALLSSFFWNRSQDLSRECWERRYREISCWSFCADGADARVFTYGRIDPSMHCNVRAHITISPRQARYLDDLQDCVFHRLRQLSNDELSGEADTVVIISKRLEEVLPTIFRDSVVSSELTVARYVRFESIDSLVDGDIDWLLLWVHSVAFSPSAGVIHCPWSTV